MVVGGGGSDKTKLILISTLVEVVVEVEVELGNCYFAQVYWVGVIIRIKANPTTIELNSAWQKKVGAF